MLYNLPHVKVDVGSNLLQLSGNIENCGTDEMRARSFWSRAIMARQVGRLLGTQILYTREYERFYMIYTPAEIRHRNRLMPNTLES